MKVIFTPPPLSFLAPAEVSEYPPTWFVTADRFPGWPESSRPSRIPIGDRGNEEAGNDGSLDFRSAEPIREFRENGKLEFRRVTTPAGKMNTENVFARRLGWKIDKEDLVEAPFAENLWWEGGNVVCCGDNKNRLGVFLHTG